MNKEKALRLLQKRIDGIKMVEATNRFGATFTKWHQDTITTIRNVFNDESHTVAFQNIMYRRTDSCSEDDQQREYDHDLERAEAILDSFVDEIKEHWSERGTDDLPADAFSLRPGKVTLKWLYNNLRIDKTVVSYVVAIILGSFLLGIMVGQIPMVRQLIEIWKQGRLVTQETPPVKNSEHEKEPAKEFKANKSNSPEFLEPTWIKVDNPVIIWNGQVKIGLLDTTADSGLATLQLTLSENKEEIRLHKPERKTFSFQGTKYYIDLIEVKRGQAMIQITPETIGSIPNLPAK